MLNTSDFCHPADEWRGVDFWMLNDALDDEELRFQLREMYDKGVRAFIARTYIGLKSDYPGPGFKAKMHTIVACAKELGMKLYLQAGFMPEAVPGLPEQFTACSLLECAPGKFDFVRQALYVNMLDREAVRFYLQKSYEEMWQEFSPEFGKTIQSIWVDEPSYSSSGLPWCDELPEMYRARCGKEIEFPALFHNTPGCAQVRMDYWNIVVRLLEKKLFSAGTKMVSCTQSFIQRSSDGRRFISCQFQPWGGDDAFLPLFGCSRNRLSDCRYGVSRLAPFAV